MNDKGWVNFPDYQGRIWRNRPNILWKNAVHEVLEGYKEYSFLPQEEGYCFYHPNWSFSQCRADCSSFKISR